MPASCMILTPSQICVCKATCQKKRAPNVTQATVHLLNLLCVCGYPVKKRPKMELNRGLFYVITATAQ